MLGSLWYDQAGDENHKFSYLKVDALPNEALGVLYIINPCPAESGYALPLQAV